MKYDKLIYIFIIVLVSGCSTKTEKESISKTENKEVLSREDSINLQEKNIFPMFLDKNKNYEERRITLLQDIGKIEYIKLETTANSLLLGKNRLLGLYLTNENIFLSTGDNVLRFNKKGTFLNSIGKKGNGPGEISRVVDFLLDQENKEIIIWDGGTRKLITYDYEGNIKNSISLQEYCDDLGTICGNQILCTTYIPNSRPMAFTASLQNGEITNNLLHSYDFKDRTGLTIVFTDKWTQNILYNEKVIYQNFINDTIYSIDKKNLNVSPRYIQLPPNTGLDGENSLIFVTFETDRYANIIVSKRPPLSYTFVIDKKENKIYKGFFADLNTNKGVSPINTNIDNVIADLYESHELQNLLEKEYLSGELKQIAETLKEEDNPVLMLATINY